MGALSGDPRFTGIFVQDIAVRVADNDEAGMVVAFPNGPLRVFEQRAAGQPALPSNLVVATYTIVLTRAPEENVQVTAAVVPISERDRRAGGEGIALCAGTTCNPATASKAGVTLLFSRTNWFVPQTITVVAPADALSEGTRTAIIQHTIVQGASSDDGGAYDSLKVLSTSVIVIDDDAADAVTARIDPATLKADGTLNVTEDVCTPMPDSTATEAQCQIDRHSLPYNDAFQVFLTREPADDVHIVVTSDGQTQIWNGSTYVNTITLTFEKTHWSDAEDGQGPRGPRRREGGPALLARSRTRCRRARPATFLALTLDNVAAGLAAAVNADPSGHLTATAAGSRVTIDSVVPFTAAITGGEINDDDSSISPTSATSPSRSTRRRRSSSGIAGRSSSTASATSTPRRWATATPRSPRSSRGVVNGSSRFSATWTSGTTFTVSQRNDLPFVASMATADGSLPERLRGRHDRRQDVRPRRVRRSTYITGTAVQPSDAWKITLNPDTPAKLDFSYVAGHHGEETAPDPMDVQIADDDAPTVLVTESGGSTNVIEPTRFVVLGQGLVTAVTTRRTSAPTSAPPS